MSNTNEAATAEERTQQFAEQCLERVRELLDENVKLAKENWILRERMKCMLEEIPN